MTTGALLLIAHQFVLLLLDGGGFVPLTVYPTFGDCMEARGYYINAGMMTKCERLE